MPAAGGIGTGTQRRIDRSFLPFGPDIWQHHGLDRNNGDVIFLQPAVGFFDGVIEVFVFTFFKETGSLDFFGNEVFVSEHLKFRFIF